MKKKLRQIYALMLVSTLCLQPVYTYGLVKGQERNEVFKEQVQSRAEQTNTNKAYEIISSHNATVRNGKYADKNAGTSGGTIPRDKLEVKFTADPDYSRRGYMEFGITAEEYKQINWDNVAKITLHMRVKEFFGTDKTNTVTLYNTTDTATDKWNEENVTWDTAPSLIPTGEIGSNALGQFTFEENVVGELVEVDITNSIKEYLKDATPENGNIRLGLGMDIESIYDQGGIVFYSKNYSNGINAPYITIHEGTYQDTTAPIVTVTGLNEIQEVFKDTITFSVEASDNYDSQIVPQITVNGSGEGIVLNQKECTVKLNPGKNIIQIQAVDQAGNTSSIKNYTVNYIKKDIFVVGADAYIQSDKAGQNLGATDSTKLLLKKSKTGNERRVYLNFDLAGYDKSYIKSAVVRVYIPEVMGNDRTTEYISVFETNAFDEGTITWDNAPEKGELVTVQAVDRSKTKANNKYEDFAEIDITNYINNKLLKGEKIDKLSLVLSIEPEHSNDQKGIYISPKEAGSDKAPCISIEEGLPAPSVEIAGIQEGETLAKESIDIEVRATSVSESITLETLVTVNDQEVEGAGGKYNVPLALGKNTIKVVVTDEVGNTVENVYTVTRLEYQAPGTYYVDSEGGDDTADGKTPETAWKSLNKLNSIQFQPGTEILLKRGGVWTGQFRPNGSGSVGAPIVVDVYGQGSRPIINGNGISNKDTGNIIAEGAIHLYNLSHWEINNLEVTNTGASQENDENRAGIIYYAGGAGAVEHIYINNCYVHDVNTACRGQKMSGGILIVGDTLDEKGKETGIKTTISDVKVENCHIKDVAIEGLRTKTQEGGVNTATGERRNKDIIFRNNLIEEIHGDGIVISEIAEGGVVEKNIIRKHSSCPVTLNYAACWSWNTNETTFRQNEVYDGVHGYNDGEAFDFDIGSENTIYEHNYSHNNRGGFLLTMSGLREGNIFRYNISKNDGQGTEIFFCANDKPLIHNNTIYIGEGMNVPYFIRENAGAKFNFVNNIVQVEGTLGKFSNGLNPSARFENNCFYPASVAQLPGNPVNHPGLITENPMLMNPEGIDQVMDIWTRDIWEYNIGKFQVASGSPVIDAGINIANNGGQDIFGNPLYTNGQADIGAHEFRIVSENPQVSMDKNQEITGGQSFEVVVGAKYVDQPIYAQDLIVNYDESLFDFVGVDGIGKTQVVDTKVEEGKVRILLATEEGLETDKDSIALRFASSRVASTTTSAITLSDINFGTVVEGIAQTVVGEGAMQIVTVKPAPSVIDKTELNNTITEAEKLSKEAVIGNKVGQYPKEVKEALDTAILIARQVTQTSSSQSEIDAATSALRKAINIFKEAQIKADTEDVNKDGKVNVADLALIAYYYQETSTGDKWEEAKQADINQDGTVNILDLTEVAKKLLNQ